MRINKLSCIGLLFPVLLFAGVQALAQAAADSRIPAADPASHYMTRPHGDMFLISDRAFLRKSIERIALDQSFKSQSAGTGCSSSTLSRGSTSTFFSRECPIIDCPAPPPGCFYQNPPTNQNGCVTGCGELVCGPEI